MYKKQEINKGLISINESYEGETIEQKINRITNNKEPITDGAPLIYTERKKGTEAQYNIKTDRFEIAVDAMDKVNRTNIAKRDEVPVIDINTKTGEDKVQPTDGTGT